MSTQNTASRLYTRYRLHKWREQCLSADTATYTLRIAQVGYEEYEAPIAHIGDSMHVVLKPIKKGEVFVMRNLHFATNKTRILSSSEEALEALFGYPSAIPKFALRLWDTPIM